MEHDPEPIRAELARISDALTRIEAKLADLLGVDDPCSWAVDAGDAAPERVDPYGPHVVPRSGRPGRVNLAHAEHVSRYLEQLAGAPIPPSRLVDNIGGYRDATRRALRWLEDEGYVAVTPGRRNSRMYTSRRPFRAPSAHA